MEYSKVPLSDDESVNKDMESQPLTSEENFRYDPPTYRNRLKKIFTLTRAYVVALHIVTIITLGLLWYHDHEIPKVDGVVKSWTPYDGSVEYEIRDMTVGGSPEEHRLYGGYPDDAQDRAWDALMKPLFWNASTEDLLRAGEPTDRVTQLKGGGHLATTWAYHHLHCLRNLRLYVYKERYYPNQTETQYLRLQAHLDHCLETLRAGVMCNANTGVYTFNWPAERVEVPHGQSNSKAVCARWSTVHDWATKNMIPMVWGDTQREEWDGKEDDAEGGLPRYIQSVPDKAEVQVGTVHPY